MPKVLSILEEMDPTRILRFDSMQCRTTQPAVPGHRRGVSRTTSGLLIGLVVLLIAGTILGSVSLLAYFGVIGTHSGTPTPVTHGGTWIADLINDPGPLIPNMAAPQLDEALYLPLFYGDGQGIIHPAAAAEIPTVHNGGISADIKTWTFHLRPHLVWTDGAPYDARDVDFTWKLWLNPAFGGYWSMPPQIIKSADVSADHLSITFHLSQAYAPFLSLRSFLQDWHNRLYESALVCT